MLPAVQGARNPRKALEDCAELVLAHQTYGSKVGDVQRFACPEDKSKAYIYTNVYELI